MRLEHTARKELLLKEYAAANGLGQLDATNEYVAAAIRFLYMRLRQH